jgi:hypothetical protein
VWWGVVGCGSFGELIFLVVAGSSSRNPTVEHNDQPVCQLMSPLDIGEIVLEEWQPLSGLKRVHSLAAVPRRGMENRRRQLAAGGGFPAVRWRRFSAGYTKFGSGEEDLVYSVQIKFNSLERISDKMFSILFL